MKAVWLLALLIGASLAGCTAQPANPSLAAPKLVIGSRPDGNATVFIHSAFSERAYEWIAIAIDNETRENRTDAFSIELNLQPGFYMDASAGWKSEVYQLRGRVDVFAKEERASVSLVSGDDTWATQAESFGLPYQHLLERRSR